MLFKKKVGESESMMGRFCGPGAMFKTMTNNSSNTGELSEYAPSELRALFEDWLLQLEEEIKAFAENRKSLKPEEVADAFQISRDSAAFVLKKMTQKRGLQEDESTVQEEGSHGNNR
jgi:hypothetical protein